MAAVLAAGEGTALSHLSAAALWRIWRRRAAGIDVVAPRQRRLRGVRVHTFRRLDPRDVTTRNGIPVTTVARTLVDLTDSLDQYQLANVIHEAAFLELFNARATTTAMARANGRHHLASLNAAVRAHNTGSAGTRSKLEDRFLALVHEAGLPEPRVNTHVHTASRSIEVDFHWPELNLCVEVDGHGHNRPPTRQDDQARDAALTAAGHRVVRLAEHDLDLQAVLGRIRA
jgi:very-short-patch-repair endonuclease